MREIAGDILYVDLSERRAWREPVPHEDILKFLGGRGLNAHLLWKLTGPDTDPLGPESPLVFGTGLLSGTEAPCSGRTTVTCRSPATGWYLKTSGGGHWGGELKFAGIGYLVIKGKADHPVYLWIDDGRVEFRDARPIWGADVRQTDLAIKKEVGDGDIQVAVIGPAGERLVKFAGIMFSVYNTAARGGAGAAMGAKNLKAVAVRGTGALRAAQPARFHQAAAVCRRALLADSGGEGLARYGTSGSVEAVNELRAWAAYNFQRSRLDDVYAVSGQCLAERGYLKRRVACLACVFGCHRYTELTRGEFAGCYTGGPELETVGALGSGCGVSDPEAIIKANELCNVLGMDTISCGSVIAWAMECYEKGLISARDLDGLDLRWGDGRAVIEMVRRIAYRQGFGDVLAEGVRAAARHVGGDSYRWAMEAKGLEQSRVDTRSAKAYALAFAVNPRGPDHLHTETFAEFGLSPEGRALIARITGDEKYANPYLAEKRAEIVRWHEDCYAVTDALGFCAFSSTALYGVTPARMAELFSAATGHEISEEEIMRAGRRIVTLEKCFNVRAGAVRADDSLPWRLMHERTPDRPDADAINAPEELSRMLDEYYSLHGWDPETSWPTSQTLESLDLGDVGRQLAAVGKLG
ncbi:MAG: aldehyde ferredoxin oxidoreductase family protein [Firmicutes bacterium]|nr:aldehyde ferredoxin oxidoreductase family protein [Bacillota bacterium]